MKSLSLAIALALLAVAGVFFGLVKLAKFDESVAAQLATAMMAAIPYIRELIDKTFLAQQDPTRPAVIPIGEFGLSPGRMVLYGTLIVIGAMNLAAGLGGVSAAFIGVTTDEQVLRVMLIVGSLIQYPVIYGVGAWVGRRCASHGVAVTLLISFLARLATALLDRWLLPEFISKILPSSLILSLVMGALLIALVGLLGYWRGRRLRDGSYVSYLFRSVSEDTRKAIVDLAFEEARAKLARGGQPSLP